MSDRFAAARAVADAVLYEGYVLYPYRASAPKNQIRWQCGVLFPARVRRGRRIGALAQPHRVRRRPRVRAAVDGAGALAPGAAPVDRGAARGRGGRELVPVPELDVDGVRCVPWDEAVEQELDLPPVRLFPLTDASHEERILVPGGEAARSWRPRRRRPWSGV